MTRSRKIALIVVLLLVVAAVLIPATLGGAIDASAQVVDLKANPAAFQDGFDAAAGVPRLVLLLSPA